MRIAHVVWGMKTGGVETMLVNIINEQVKTERVRLFIVNDFIDDFVVEKISHKCTIVRINRKPKHKDRLKILKLNLLLVWFWPDIVHIHSRKISKAIARPWRIVRTIHGLSNITDEYPRMKALYAISNSVANYAIKQGFHSTIIPNGIKVADMKTREKNRQGQIVHIVQVSRLYTKVKGQDILLNALNILINQNISNFKLHLIGSGPSEQELKKKTTELGMNDYVCFEGVRPQEYIYQHLCEYDLFVQPSRQEGFGLTVAEAMAAKLPVLVSNIQGPMEVIGYGKYGMTFKSGNAEDLADKLKSILEGGYDYSLIEEAYQHVCKEYNVETTSQRYLQEYQKVINKEKI